jgi:hypothetical protein
VPARGADPSPSPALYPEASARAAYQAAHPGESGQRDTKTVPVAPSAPSRFGAVFLNPYAAFDLGMSPSAAAPLALSWLVHSAPPDEPGAQMAVRLARDGRAVYRGFAAARSPFQPQAPPMLQRVLQKGDLATGVPGSHNDGQVTAAETLREMVYSEILHRNGVDTSRILLGATVPGSRRLLADNDPADRAAGVELRLGERPRFIDGQAPPYFNLLSRQSPSWSNPLIVSGLQNVPADRRARVVATIGEGIVKDLWGLHGSLTAENRGEAAIDFGTFSFLSEPNPGAAVFGGDTPYLDEIRFSEETPDSFFLDTFAFRQLERAGLPDDEILATYFERHVEHFSGGDFVSYRAKPPGLALARAIADLDAFSESAPGGEPFQADHGGRERTEYRVAFNTRELLREMVLGSDAPYASAALSDAQARRLLDGALSPVFHRENPLDGRLGHMRESRYADVRAIQQALHLAAPYIAAHPDQVRATAEAHPIAQTLPRRDEVERQAQSWLADPARFPEGFRHYVEQFDPAADHARLAAYYDTPVPPSGPTAESLFGRLAGSPGAECPGLYRDL